MEEFVGCKIQLWAEGNAVTDHIEVKHRMELNGGEILQANGKLYEVQDWAYIEEHDVWEIECRSLEPDFIL